MIYYQVKAFGHDQVEIRWALAYNFTVFVAITFEFQILMSEKIPNWNTFRAWYRILKRSPDVYFRTQECLDNSVRIAFEANRLI